MKYKIILKETNIPLKAGVLTDKGIIISSDNVFLNETLFLTASGSAFVWQDLKSIVISLQEISELEQPKTLRVSKSINDTEEIPFDINNEVHKLLWEGVKLHNSKTIECSLELQVILLDKFNQGIVEIDENDIELIRNCEYVYNGYCSADIPSGHCRCNEVAILKQIIEESVEDIWDELETELSKYNDVSLDIPQSIRQKYKIINL